MADLRNDDMVGPPVGYVVKQVACHDAAQMHLVEEMSPEETGQALELWLALKSIPVLESRDILTWAYSVLYNAMPISKKQTVLADISEGETVYTMPWTMFVGRDEFLWLENTPYFTHRPYGMMVLAVTKRDGRYIVNVAGCGDYWWSGGLLVPDTSIPVDELKGAYVGEW